MNRKGDTPCKRLVQVVRTNRGLGHGRAGSASPSTTDDTKSETESWLRHGEVSGIERVIGGAMQAVYALRKTSRSLAYPIEAFSDS